MGSSGEACGLTAGCASLMGLDSAPASVPGLRERMAGDVTEKTASPGSLGYANIVLGLNIHYTGDSLSNANQSYFVDFFEKWLENELNVLRLKQESTELPWSYPEDVHSRLSAQEAWKPDLSAKLEQSYISEVDLQLKEHRALKSDVKMQTYAGRKHTLSLGYSVKFSRYPGRLLAVAFHYVEVTEDGEADFHKELETEQGEDGEVDVRELLSEGPAFFYHRHRCPSPAAAALGQIQVPNVPGSGPGCCWTAGPEEGKYQLVTMPPAQNIYTVRKSASHPPIGLTVFRGGHGNTCRFPTLLTFRAGCKMTSRLPAPNFKLQILKEMKTLSGAPESIVALGALLTVSTGYIGKRPCEDTTRRRLSTSQEERPPQKPTLTDHTLILDLKPPKL
ncbi:uncharacterized protein LOC132356727 [Balaenoptera ricei]|uniref:uncharacterized protein LOC132356727 n=1 Tax=Balaenoptera ricei TaxID=2746895 RepID=UPI0028BD3C0A|nr:uncharacterized protein LOC132356727 [Balaenoptera ricei]